MPEPIDTIRRVNSDEPMTLQELYAARATLDRYISTRKTDVREARRRVGAMIAELEPAGTPAPSAAPGAATSGVTHVVGDQPAAASKAPAKQSGNPALGFVVLLVIVGSVVYACADRDDDSPSSGGNDRSEGMAKVMCENFIEDRLKAPSTADFSGIFDTEITGSGDDYTVRGYVDAQNSFGAAMRSNYTCQIHDDGDDRWSLVSLTGLN